ncbi:50S ribosomal protein L11 methyltransferase [Flocculibacter collagenilyticus]|uniref:50S ribosomal protein L11 methyltransferase n=1 Tax=Flocculibacter collagenilyticus TaxID=2744479 RepID=UPI0018F590E2|nr:50S ribosomal protein L11 methyltransferase [Flocculibacter collagenilyticus]
MPWIQIRVNATETTAEQIGDALSDMEAQAVTFMDAKDTPIFEPKIGEVVYWANTVVIGLFDAETNMQAVVDYLQAQPVIQQFGDDQFVYKVEQLEDKDWEREWMDNFHPIKFGERLWICPSWRDIPDPNAVNVMLDPGLAFGTGTHATTALCLEWLEQLDLTDKTVVDFGCGSGILGIAALKLGAKRVIGIDIDPQAIEASKENAKRNGVEGQIELYLPANQPSLEADIVVANILAEPLISLSDVIMAYLKPQGEYVLSGILDSQINNIRSVYQQYGSLADDKIKDEWARVSGKKA